jgi:RNA polymerase sigma factor (sigma-70 family)
VQHDSRAGGAFPTTQLSAVRGAASTNAEERRRSWDALVAAYWRPAYVHARLRWRLAPEDAEDAVQAFFERAVTKGFWDGFEASKGRFRTFFRVCLDRDLSNHARAETRLKRGGGARHVALEAAIEAEEALSRTGGPAAPSPDEVFDREWRRTIFGLALSTLDAECTAKGRALAFRVLVAYDLADPDERPTYAQLGRELGETATTITNQLAYARRELRRVVIERLEAITATPEELESEVRSLLGGEPR